MKGKRFTEEQIITVLKEAEAGLPVAELLRRHGIAAATLYRWKSQYGGLEVNELKRLRQLEAENRQLKEMVANLMLDLQVLKDLAAKNWLRPQPSVKPSSTPGKHTA